jgi:hypothetical protein
MPRPHHPRTRPHADPSRPGPATRTLRPGSALGVAAIALTLAAVLVALAAAAPGCDDLARAPSSRWRVTTEHGVASLITPCGDRFFSLGVNVVDGGSVAAQPSYWWNRHYPDAIAFAAATRARLLA